MSRFLYSLLAYALLPVLAVYLLWRSRKQPEYRRHWGERTALTLPEVAQGAMWIHAVSLGETLAVESLVLALRERYPDRDILLTHMTPTGRAAGERLATRVGGVHVCYLPYDTPMATRRFIRQVRPAFGLLMETEVWPNLVAACVRDKVPLALINARLSEKSLARGQTYAGLAREALQGLAMVLAQTPGDAERLALLGARAPKSLGNLKFDIHPAEGLLARGRAWRARFAQSRVLLLANTREGEEAMLLEHLAKAGLEDCLYLLVPRHPQRFDVVEREVRALGFSVLRRSVVPEDAGKLPAVQVLLGDSLGEMPAYYAAADLCIMGGSFAPLGGHNLIEACACSCPIILGPHTFNFAQASEQAVEAGAAWRVGNAAEALALAGRLLEGADGADRPEHVGGSELVRAREACSRYAIRHQGATERTLEALRPLLPRK